MNELLKNAVWIIIVVGIFAVVVSFNRNRVDDDLNGVWKLESTQTNGMPEHRDRELWVIRGGSLSVVRDDNSYSAKISVDPSTSPKQFDSDIMFRRAGIYEIDGDTLRVSQALNESHRPTQFKTMFGDMCSVSILRRVNATPQNSSDYLKQLMLSEFGPATEYPDPMEFDLESEEFISGLMRKFYDQQEALTAKEEAVYQVSWLMTEVDNGGFHQYYYNSSGNTAMETAALLRKIGAPQTAKLVEAGCDLFPDDSPAKDLKKRREQLQEFTLDQIEALRDLEQRFYSRREDLNLLLMKYWNGGP